MIMPRVLYVLLLALGLCSPALAHPHGVMQCSMAVIFEGGRPTVLSGSLLMDAAHSKDMQAMLRDPATGQLDGQRQQRFMFSLKMQLARSNWLLGAKEDGVAAEFTLAREPVLVLTEEGSAEGRVGVDVQLQIKPAGSSATGGRAAAVPVTLPPMTDWQFSCGDPTFYWVTEFTAPSVPLAVTGCAAPVLSNAVAVATGARAGSVLVDMRCGGR